MDNGLRWLRGSLQATHLDRNQVINDCYSNDISVQGYPFLTNMASEKSPCSGNTSSFKGTCSIARHYYIKLFVGILTRKINPRGYAKSGQILKFHQPHDWKIPGVQKISLSKFATFRESPNFNPHLGAGLMHGSHDHFQPTVGILKRQRFDACDQHFAPGSDAQKSLEKTLFHDTGCLMGLPL